MNFVRSRITCEPLCLLCAVAAICTESCSSRRAAYTHTVARMTSTTVDQNTRTVPYVDSEAVRSAQHTFESGDQHNHSVDIHDRRNYPFKNTTPQPVNPHTTNDNAQSAPVDHSNQSISAKNDSPQPNSHPRVSGPHQSQISTANWAEHASGSANIDLEQPAASANSPAPTNRNASAATPESNTFLVSLAKPARQFALRMAEIGLFRSHDYSLEALRQDIDANPTMINSSRYRTVQQDLPLTAFEQRFISKMVVEAKIVNCFATKRGATNAMAVGILVTVNNGKSSKLTITAKLHPGRDPSDGRISQPLFLSGLHGVPKTKPTVKTHNTDKGVNGGLDGPEPSPLKVDAHIACCSSYNTEHSPTTEFWRGNKNCGVYSKTTIRLLCEEDDVARKGVNDTIPLLVLIDKEHDQDDMELPGPIVMTIDVEIEQHLYQQFKMKQLPRHSLGVAVKLPLVVRSGTGDFEGDIFGWTDEQKADLWHAMRHC